MITPWGIADHKRHYAIGITFYGTPRHGGFKINKKQLETMPEHLRVEGGWYEEDCEYSKVVLAFPFLFSAEEIEHAKQSFSRWFNTDGSYKREA